MLDIDKLYADFQVLIEQYDERDFDAWITFDNNRLMLSQLLSGESVSVPCVTAKQKVTNVQATNGPSESFGGDNINYRLAA